MTTRSGWYRIRQACRVNATSTGHSGPNTAHQQLLQRRIRHTTVGSGAKEEQRRQGRARGRAGRHCVLRRLHGTGGTRRRQGRRCVAVWQLCGNRFHRQTESSHSRSPTSAPPPTGTATPSPSASGSSRRWLSPTQATSRSRSSRRTRNSSTRVAWEYGAELWRRPR
jgi:hypothetical protein